VVLTCTFCELPFRPTDAQLLTWADTGALADPNTVECPDCQRLDLIADVAASYGVDPADVEPDDSPDEPCPCGGCPFNMATTGRICDPEPGDPCLPVNPDLLATNDDLVLAELYDAADYLDPTTSPSYHSYYRTRARLVGLS